MGALDMQKVMVSVAMKHCLMTMESDFSKAMGRLVGKAVQKSGAFE